MDQNGAAAVLRGCSRQIGWAARGCTAAIKKKMVIGLAIGGRHRLFQSNNYLFFATPYFIVSILAAASMTTLQFSDGSPPSAHGLRLGSYTAHRLVRDTYQHILLVLTRL